GVALPRIRGGGRFLQVGGRDLVSKNDYSLNTFPHPPRIASTAEATVPRVWTRVATAASWAFRSESFLRGALISAAAACMAPARERISSWFSCVRILLRASMAAG